MFLPVCFSRETLENNELTNCSDEKMINLFMSRIVEHLDDPEILLRKEVFLQEYEYIIKIYFV